MSNLGPSYDISTYQFDSFNEGNSNSEIEVFDFKDLSSDIPLTVDTEKKIKKERAFATSSGFKIDDRVSEARGLRQQESDEIERKIALEVEKRVKVISEDAFKSGYEEGVEKGRADISLKMSEDVEDRLAALTAMVSEVVRYREEILKNKNQEIYKTIKTLTRWIILRELKDDGEYIERLLEKLIVELETRKNILIQVNQKYFESMPEVLKVVEKNLGKLENVRVELDYDIDGIGIIVESENGIVDGTLDVQLENLDRLFSDVGI